MSQQVASPFAWHQPTPSFLPLSSSLSVSHINTRDKAVKTAAPELSVSRHKSCEAVTNFFAEMLRISLAPRGTVGEADEGKSSAYLHATTNSASEFSLAWCGVLWCAVV